MKQKRDAVTGFRAVLTDIAVFLLCALFFGLLLFSPLVNAEPRLTEEEAALEEAYRQGDVIRLHILAASDSPEDQRIKLQVRDAVLDAFGRTLAQAGSIGPEEVWRLLLEKAPMMETVARQCALECGFAGTVSAQVGRLALPEKRYGQLVLPKGVYRGLRITLGDGAGQNWWCVLYPRLCLALTDEEAGGEAADAMERAHDGSAETNDEPPFIVWRSERILSQWLASPGSTAAFVAADIVDTE